MTISIGFGLGIIYTQNIVSAGGPPVNTVAPSIAITAGGGYAGSTYTATAGTWDTGSPTGQWYADGVAISGETASTYVMTLAKEGTVIKYRETNSGVTADSNTIEMWVPSDATGTLVALMDIRQGITEASSLVSRWDSQANSTYADQSVGANQPLYSATSYNGTPGITFDGINDYLQNLSTGGDSASWSVVHGLMYNVVSGYQTLLGSNNNDALFYWENNSETVVQIQAVAYVFNVATTRAIATPYLKSARWTVNSNPYSLRRNGLLQGSGTTSANTPVATSSLKIGKSNSTDWLKGCVSSYLIWKSYISDTDNEKAEGWLAHTTYNSLDAGHTYYAAGPTI